MQLTQCCSTGAARWVLQDLRMCRQDAAEGDVPQAAGQTTRHGRVSTSQQLIKMREYVAREGLSQR